MRIDLTGKTAVVTGSSEGIGLGIAQGLAGAGATVVLNGRKQASLDAAAAADLLVCAGEVAVRHGDSSGVAENALPVPM